MVHISLRQNRRGATDQNTLERHAQGPGSPLTEIPGDGFYDWAGRRLFLPDGQPDPHTPGAYRYQHDPECTDLQAPDSDPNSPRYEPPHLRHRPGDTWEIGGKPTDPEDPGPYGTPGWFQDTRTGRHRRGELPDPLPPEAEAEAPTRPNRIRFRGESDQSSADRPSPGPRRRWFEPAAGPDSGHSAEHAADHAGNHTTDYAGDRAGGRVSGHVGGRAGERVTEQPEATRTPETAETDEPYRFSKLREDAWDRWLIDSAPLAAAHTRPQLDREGGRTIAMLLRAFRWILALLTGTDHQSHHTKQHCTQAHRATATPAPVAPTQPTAPAANLRCAPANSRLPRPWTGNGYTGSIGYIATWERAFDARHPITAGGLAGGGLA